jgi:lysophospholipase L1-like esterase
VPGRNGRRTLLPILKHYEPLDLIVILLGTNDLKGCFDRSATAIAEGMKQLCHIIMNSKNGRDGRIPEILIVAPPPILRLPSKMRIEFEGAIEKSKRLGKHYFEIAGRQNAHFLDAKTVIPEGPAIDPVHWDRSGHKLFGECIAGKVKRIFAGSNSSRHKDT